MGVKAGTEQKWKKVKLFVMALDLGYLATTENPSKNMLSASFLVPLDWPVLWVMALSKAWAYHINPLLLQKSLGSNLKITSVSKSHEDNYQKPCFSLHVPSEQTARGNIRLTFKQTSFLHPFTTTNFEREFWGSSFPLPYSTNGSLNFTVWNINRTICPSLKAINDNDNGAN